MSDPNLPPPPGEGQQPPGGVQPPPPGQPPAQPPAPGGFPPPTPGAPPPPGGFQAPPPGQPGGYSQPPAQPYQPATSGAVAGPAGTVLSEPVKRIISLIIDAAILWVVSMIIGLIIAGGTMTFGTSFDGRSLLAALVMYLIQFAYYAFLIGTRGQTLGGMILKIKVIGVDGSPATQEQAFKRAAIWLLPIIPCLGSLAELVLVIWGLVNLFSDPLRQTPWDKFAETVAVDAE